MRNPREPHRVGRALSLPTLGGMDAALYMALSRTLIRTYAPQHHDRPDHVFKIVNRRILQDSRAGYVRHRVLWRPRPGHGYVHLLQRRAQSCPGRKVHPRYTRAQFPHFVVEQRPAHPNPRGKR